MSKIDKIFNWLNLTNTNYDYLDKNRNISNNIAYMMDRSNIMFKWHNLPETIPQREIEKLLQGNGFCIIGKINNELYALNGGLGGELDVYNYPTIATISVPYFNFNATWKIGTDCIVIYNDTCHLGLFPLYSKYCTMLTENEISLLISDINHRMQSLISANDDATIASARQYLQDIYKGKFGIIAESKLFDSLKVNPNTETTNSIESLIKYNEYLKAVLFNEIGLNANTNLKKERLLNGEIENNSEQLYPFIDDMLSNRRNGIEALNKMFSLNVECELNSSWDYRIHNGMSIHNVNDEIPLSDIEESTNDTIEESTNEKEDN